MTTSVEWFSADGGRGLSPALLAMVSVLQYAENMTDRHAAQSAHCRIDWKYCLARELTDIGFDYSVLSEFRDRLTVVVVEAAYRSGARMQARLALEHGRRVFLMRSLMTHE